MAEFGSNLRRRVWQPFLVIIGVAVAGPFLFTFYLPPTPLRVWSYAILLVLVVFVMGSLLVRRVVSSVQNLARAATQASPETLRESLKHPDEIAALAETITTITTEMREKEQTWMGDLERRNQAVQELTKIVKEQAAGFETALNSMDIPVCLFESDGNLLQTNQRFCQFLGMTAETLKPMGLLSIVAELQKFVPNSEELKQAAQAIYRKPSTSSDINFPLNEGRGNLRLYCAPIFGEMSSLIGIIISTGESADSSEVERLKGEFISTVSHELRTPLTAIKGAVGLVLGGAGGPVPGTIRELLEIASNSTDRLIQLVNDILEVFRMEAGKLPLKPAPVAPEDLIRQACTGVQAEAEAAGIRIETHLAPNMPPALVDAEQVQMVLEKLISNAIKFSTRGSSVRIDVGPVKADPRFLQFAVQDFGKGIPSEAQNRIFEKFEQAESVMTREHQGPGLGLAICRGVVEGHGGQIGVKSEPGKGSTFYASLPAAPATEIPTPFAAVHPTLPPQTSPPHLLVMVVEDDADTRNVIARMLQSQGHFVMEISSGHQVPDLAQRHRPEVIILDLLMPDIDGLEVLRKLKADAKTRRIPVIGISVSDESLSQVLQLGAAQFIQKPLEPDTLLRAVQAACAKAAAGAD